MKNRDDEARDAARNVIKCNLGVASLSVDYLDDFEDVERVSLKKRGVLKGLRARLFHNKHHTF